MPSHRQIGPYLVVRQLGQGGMGVVYEVQDPALPRTLALKLTRSHGSSSLAVDRFVREAAVLAKIHHPNVVRIHTVGRVAEGPYLVQELIEGETLDKVREGWTAEDAARVVRDLASALAAIHGQGILHRDLKPANVILRPDGTPVLLDFGLARDVDSQTLTQTGVPLGTPAYMSPEQARGSKDLDGRTDVYGLGAILFRLLTGRTAFEGPPLVIMSLVANDDPPAPSTLAEVPPALDAVCQMAMARDRDQRYPDALSLCDDLDRYLREHHSDAEGHMGAVRRRRALRSGLIALGVLTLLGLLGLGVRAALSDDHPESTPEETAVEPPAPAAGDAAAPSPLWALKPKDELNVHIEYRENDSRMEMEVDIGISARVPVVGGRGRLDCEIVWVRSKFGAIGGGSTFDSRKPDPAHPLAAFGKAVGRRFQLTIDPKSGAVSNVEGVNAIGRLITSERTGLDLGKGILTRGAFTPDAFKIVFGRALSDSFMSAALDTVLHVAEPYGRVAWLQPVPTPDGDRRFRLALGKPRAYLIRPLSPNWRLESDHRFRIEGETIYAPGRVRKARIHQVLRGKLNREGKLTPIPKHQPGSDIRLRVIVGGGG